MGTRSLTIVLSESDKEICVLYRQMDGYPSGHGQELADFLREFTIVNGIRGDEPGPYANGMDCLAAQLVAHFKTEPGGFYLFPSGTRNAGEEYVYYIKQKYGAIYMDVVSVYSDGGPLYKGPAKSFSAKELEEGID